MLHEIIKRKVSTLNGFKTLSTANISSNYADLVHIHTVSLKYYCHPHSVMATELVLEI